MGKPLLLNRPNDGGDLDTTWDGVFNTCPRLFKNTVGTLTANNWRVKLTGGKGNVDEVRVQFIRATPDDLNVEVTLQLIDRGPYDFDGDNTFLPDAKKPKKTYTLNDYSIFGSSLKGTNPRLKCDNTRDDRVELGIVLEIKLTP